ncbi:hypothetical protein PG984_012550 [Apiospora sp. TS-2023a]
MEATVTHLFKGTDDAIDIIGKLIAGGRFVEGSSRGKDDSTKVPDSDTELRHSIQRAFWAYTIPVGWTLSGTHAFVLDTGLTCTDGKPNMKGDEFDDYVLYKDRDSVGACHKTNGRFYYLLGAKGAAHGGSGSGGATANLKFSKPNGIDKLVDGAYGGITLQDVITGSVNTYESNGLKNGAPANMGKSRSVDELYDTNILSPGYMRIPVCTAQLAHYNWEIASKKSDSMYPCQPSDPDETCGDSTFVDRTHGGSPFVSDCLTLARNIAVHDEDKVDSSTNQHQLHEFGTCAFGAEARGLPRGNIYFRMGNTDIIDIIEDSIRKFAKDGRVAAKGDMTCKGNTPTNQPMTWGIYWNPKY